LKGGRLILGISNTLKALSDPVRREILMILRDEPLNAGQIAIHFDVTDATISHHLAVLKKAGLIDATRYGTFINYEINTSLFEEVIAWLVNLKGESPL
jgi:DNA-binding transcriptional ArsR family regulator